MGGMPVTVSRLQKNKVKSFISPFLGRLDDTSAEGIFLIEDIVTLKEKYPSYDFEIISASIRSRHRDHPVCDHREDESASSDGCRDRQIPQGLHEGLRRINEKTDAFLRKKKAGQKKKAGKKHEEYS